MESLARVEELRKGREDESAYEVGATFLEELYTWN